MGDEDKIDTMLNAFLEHHDWGEFETPAFNKEHWYFMIRKDDAWQEMVSDSWDGFKAGWLAREAVDERTVEGW
jgi:cupin superfamily acireductone dioxygenase involved in methionine salvage